MFDYARTQIHRHKVSAPMRWMLDHYNFSDLSVIHFGEGRSYSDTRALKDVAHKVTAFDPYSETLVARDSRHLLKHYNVGIAVYVFNVLPPRERLAAWYEFSSICDINIWAVRADKVDGVPYKDGVITKANTFQKSYTPESAGKEWPSATIIESNSNFIIMEQ